MSTRSVIARKDGMSFKGVYHHWDGYPSGLGATLFELRNGHFKGDTQAMLSALIDDHPAGWSTINGADWTQCPGFTQDQYNCEICGEPDWKHYAQNYASHGLPEPPHPEGNWCVFDHSPKRPETARRPECYCHGQRHEEANAITEQNAADCGCEWAYVFDGNGKMEVQSSYRRDGHKMIGMFGCGDPDSVWRTIAVVDLNGEEPDWEKMES